jgi:sulfatase maturation enzyme AslB (radical SAM superfamily)
MSIEFWLKDPTILFKENIMELWPKSSMSYEEKLNAITRLIIVLIIIGLIITQNLNILMLGIITLIIIILLYYNNHKKESFKNIEESSIEKYYKANKESFQQPINNNPLMNIVLPQIHYEPNRKPAAPSFLPEVSQTIDNCVKEFVSKPFKDPTIKNKLFSNVGDEFNFNRSMIQYNTMPNTLVPSDQKSFLEYLYGTMISGKEGNPLALYRNNAGAYNYMNP